MPPFWRRFAIFFTAEPSATPAGEVVSIGHGFPASREFRQTCRRLSGPCPVGAAVTSTTNSVYFGTRSANQGAMAACWSARSTSSTSWTARPRCQVARSPGPARRRELDPRERLVRAPKGPARLLAPADELARQVGSFLTFPDFPDFARRPVTFGGLAAASGSYFLTATWRVSARARGARPEPACRPGIA